MKTLVLFRHAKSSWEDAELSDHERALNARGRAAAPLMGAWIASRITPDVVLVSSARRTRETYELAAPAFKCALKARQRDDLYLAAAEALLIMVRMLPDTISTALLIGHNPGLEDLAKALAGKGDKKARAAMAEKFPTAAVAILTSSIEHWKDLEPRQATLAAFMTPKRLASDA